MTAIAMPVGIKHRPRPRHDTVPRARRSRPASPGWAYDCRGRSGSSRTIGTANTTCDSAISRQRPLRVVEWRFHVALSRRSVGRVGSRCCWCVRERVRVARCLVRPHVVGDDLAEMLRVGQQPACDPSTTVPSTPDATHNASNDSTVRLPSRVPHDRDRQPRSRSRSSSAPVRPPRQIGNAHDRPRIANEMVHDVFEYHRAVPRRLAHRPHVTG